eukprot:gene25282-31720_t
MLVRLARALAAPRVALLLYDVLMVCGSVALSSTRGRALCHIGDHHLLRLAVFSISIKSKSSLREGLFIITNTRKNLWFKTEFHLVGANHTDLWTMLKRSQRKEGLEFRPLRKVGIQSNLDEYESKFKVMSHKAMEIA